MCNDYLRASLYTEVIDSLKSYQSLSFVPTQVDKKNITPIFFWFSNKGLTAFVSSGARIISKGS